MILPPPGEAFAWRETRFGPALVCRPLEAIAPHVFTSRPWPLGARADAGEAGWADVAAAMGSPRPPLIRLAQVHGRDWLRAEPLADSPGRRPQGDILLSGRRRLAVAVQAADCVPLLIADRRRGVVAAAHAGWRGLARGVPGTAVMALQESFGSQVADLVAALGPSIGSCCYEVGADVQRAFAEAGATEQDLERWFHDQPAPTAVNPSMPGLRAEPSPGHWFFDGWLSARDQLRAAGLADEQIFSARLCTASHAAVFPSYRRDGTAAGRLAAVIMASPRP